ncbi:MAG: His-Xaa-Ser system protein HxsD [Deltaproteobacteria bacterium]|nr:His-Xaa-Ser system protein HxsD [Deltaproteobacteria bacterium]MBK9365923.1 His-Xaa-Ser system protein HxsD [Deltaproteobacteria bacterium]
MNDVPETVELPYALADREVQLTLDEEVYPRDAVLGCAYLFVDRCYVFLTRPGDKQLGVRLRAKGEANEAALEALAGEFANELLNQVLRFRIGESSRRLREYTFAKAFFSQPARTSIDALLAELDAEDLAEDPLEIQVPWQKTAGAENG